MAHVISSVSDLFSWHQVYNVSEEHSDSVDAFTVYYPSGNDGLQRVDIKWRGSPLTYTYRAERDLILLAIYAHDHLYLKKSVGEACNKIKKEWKAWQAWHASKA